MKKQHFLKILPVLLAVLSTAAVLCFILLCFGSSEAPAVQPQELNLMERFDALMDQAIADARDGAEAVEKVYWIRQDALTAPKASQANYGQTNDPTTLQWLLDEAAELLEGQELLFSTDVQIIPGSTVTYYLDETIFAITWKQAFYKFAYTMCEVKVADASQFRRHVTDNTIGSASLVETSEMASSVNAVAAMSGDFYSCRRFGIVAYDGVVYQAANLYNADTCFVDENGDFIFSYRGQIKSLEEAQQFVDENNISFSLAFGPILVDNGVRCEYEDYAIGEINDEYPRAAICQKDKLHYILVTANWEGKYYVSPDLHTFAAVIDTFGVQKAYTLDGGQTGTIAMNGEVMNPVLYGEQRPISDIVYFGTALPNGGE